MDDVDALREALEHSPDNLPLRRHLARTLLLLGRTDEAETEYRTALQQAPDDTDLMLGLASVYHRARKDSQALVIVEDLARRDDPPADAFVLHARLLLRAGDVEGAVRKYRRALELDPAAADEELGVRLGVPAPGDDDEPGPWEVDEGRLRAFNEDQAGPPDVLLERPDLDFEHVGGMDDVKEEVRMKIIHPLTHSELYEAYGKTIGGGILMYGPPGCGKTHLARATAGEVHAGFIAVGIADVLDMWIGSSERNLHELFEHARRNKPCVLFFDEVDALGASRTDMRQSVARHMINQFLSELDGVEADNDGVLVLGATNAPWHLDGAFRRPGRFDEILFVPPPDEPARAAILEILLRDKPADAVDVDRVAAKTPDFSGADLKAVVNKAVEAKLKEAMRKGTPEPLVTKDLVKAARSVRPSTKDWFATARNHALYANQGGIYDDILKYLKS